MEQKVNKPLQKRKGRLIQRRDQEILGGGGVIYLVLTINRPNNCKNAQFNCSKANTKATVGLKTEGNQFLDYCTTHANAAVKYTAREMILALHSDATRLSEPESKTEQLDTFIS